MNCTAWEERVALYAGGDPAEGVEEHLAECEGCRAFCAEIRESLAVLRAGHDTQIDGAHFTAVRAGVMSEIERGRGTWRRLAWVSGVGIAAALMLGIALRPGPLPAAPARVAAVIPAAPLVHTPITPTAGVRRIRRERAAQPLVIKLQTADPNIVIYWIAD